MSGSAVKSTCPILSTHVGGGGRGSQLLVSGRSDALFGLYMFTDSTHRLSLTHRHINKYKCLLKVQSYIIMGLSWTPVAKKYQENFLM